MRKLIIFMLMMIMLVSFAVADLTTDNSFYYSYDFGNYSGTDVYDLSVNSNDAVTTNGATLGVVGIINTSVDLEVSSSQAIDCPDITIHNNWTFCSWYKPESFDTAASLVDDNSDPKMYLKVQTNGIPIAKIQKVTNNFIAGTSTLTVGSWHHLCAVWNDNNNTITIYVNGTAEGSNHDNVINIVDGLDVKYVGASDTLASECDGLLDESALWLRVLSNAEIFELYNKTNPYTPTGPTYFAVTAKSAYDDSALTDFAINMTNGNGSVYTYDDIAGTVTTDFLPTDINDWNLTFWNKTGYENKDELNYNISSDLEFSVIPTATPTITQNTFNVTSAYQDPTVWQSDYNDTVYTQDRTPTTTFNISIRSNCSVSRTSNNYSSMISANADSKCATTNVTEQSCTVPSSDKLIDGPQWLYFSCISEYGYESASYGFKGNISQDYEFIGNVTDSDSNAIANATVVIVYQNNNTVFNISTANATGYIDNVFFNNPLLNFTIYGYNPSNESQGGDIDVFVRGS